MKYIAKDNKQVIVDGVHLGDGTWLITNWFTKEQRRISNLEFSVCYDPVPEYPSDFENNVDDFAVSREVSFMNELDAVLRKHNLKLYTLDNKECRIGTGAISEMIEMVVKENSKYRDMLKSIILGNFNGEDCKRMAREILPVEFGECGFGDCP